jgi:hypothetical protein
MHEILQAGNSQSQNHIAKIALTPHLQVQALPPGDYKFFACTGSALAGPAGAHIVGFDMGGSGNHFIMSFEIWTDEAISEVAWMVVK